MLRPGQDAGGGLLAPSQHPLAELLPWLCLHGPQRVLCKDGSLLVCFEVEGVDADSLDEAAAAQVAERVEDALRSLDERFTLWSVFQRRRTRAYPLANFPNRVAQRIDDLHAQRFRAGQQFGNRHVLGLLFTAGQRDHAWAGVMALLERGIVHRTPARPLARPARQVEPVAGWRRWLGGLDRAGQAGGAWSRLERDARALETVLEGFVAGFQGLGLRRLAGAELLGFLNSCASPTRRPGPVRPPGPAAFLDALLGEDHLQVGRSTLRFSGSAGRCTVGALGIKAWPDATVPCLVEALLRVPAQLSVVQVFRFVDGENAKAHIQSVQRFHLNLRRSAFSFVREAVFGEAGEVVDDTRAVAAAEARAALEALGGQRQVYGYFNFTVLVAALPGEDLDAALRGCAAAVREAGFLVLREGLHLLSAWSGALPGQWGQLVRWHFIHAGNVADLLPLQSPGQGGRLNRYLGEQLGTPCPALACLPGLDGTTFHFNFHHADLGHCLVLGPSRSGKSMLVNFLLAQFLRYPRARVLVFDKDRSCRIPTLLQGGCWLDPGRPGGLRCNPVAQAGSAEGRAWLQGFVRELLALHGRPWQAADDAHLAAAIATLATLPGDQRRLRTLHALLPAGLAAELAGWVGDGPRAGLFDHVEDNLAVRGITCVEMGELLRDPPLARLFMRHVVRRLDAILAEVPAVPTVIYIEEAWFMLADPVFRECVRDWLKTLPKRLALAVMATQSLDDLSGSPVFSAIADNVPTRIFLANPNAAQQRELYCTEFGLNAAQLQRIARARAKRQFLVVNPRQSRFIDLALPREVVQLLRSDRHAQAVFDRCLASHPDAVGQELARHYLAALEADHAPA